MRETTKTKTVNPTGDYWQHSHSGYAALDDNLTAEVSTSVWALKRHASKDEARRYLRDRGYCDTGLRWRPRKGTMNVNELLELVLGHAVFQADEGEPPIVSRWEKGKGKLVLVIGDNASGKSFFRRVVRAYCGKNDIECMDPSMEMRMMGGLERAFVFGDETTNATGVNSINAVRGGITTSQARQSEHVLFWDEPDLGLGDEWAAGLGIKIREFATMPSPKLVAAFVVTHSRAMVAELVKGFHHIVWVGEHEDGVLIEDWLRRQVEPRDPEALSGISHERFKAIQKILDKIREGRGNQ